MNWYHRGERRYVEYGSSFRAALRFGLGRQLTDTDLQHERRAPRARRADRLRAPRRRRPAHRRHDLPDLPRPPPPAAGAGLALARIAALALVRRPGAGAARALLRRHLRQPRRPAAAGTLGMPGVRDQHAGCVGDYLVRHDLFDFLLLSLPDNDNHSHRLGPRRPGRSRSRRPTASSARLFEAAGGAEEFLRRPRGDRRRRPRAHAVERTISLGAALRRLRHPPPDRPARRSEPRRSRSARRSARR